MINKQTWLFACACMWCNCKDSLRKYLRKITGDLIDELRYVLEVIRGEIYKPTTIPMACIPVYRATACKFQVHFLELVKYSVHPYTTVDL